MQYASDIPTPDAGPRMMRPRVRRAVLDELDRPEAGVSAGGDLMGPAGPASGNTGVAGGAPRPPVRVPSASAAAPAPSAPATKPFAFAPDSVSTILRKYSHTPDGLKQAFAENPELAAVSQIGGSKGDKILDPSTGRWIDVITAAGLGGTGWQWLDDVPGQAQAAPDASGGAPGNAMRGMDPAMASIIDQVRQSIMALMGKQ